MCLKNTIYRFIKTILWCFKVLNLGHCEYQSCLYLNTLVKIYSSPFWLLMYCATWWILAHHIPYWTALEFQCNLQYPLQTLVLVVCIHTTTYMNTWNCLLLIFVHNVHVLAGMNLRCLHTPLKQSVNWIRLKRLYLNRNKLGDAGSGPADQSSLY